MSPAVALRVRELRPADLDEVRRIDALHTGQEKPAYWRDIFDRFVARPGSKRGVPPGRVALGVEDGEGLAGYLLGEVRAFEFGSEACGWVFAVGVAPGHLRSGVASGLLAEAGRRFREAGVRRARTMVHREQVPVLSFFRANGFVGGGFVQLERDLREES